MVFTHETCSGTRGYSTLPSTHVANLAFGLEDGRYLWVCYWNNYLIHVIRRVHGPVYCHCIPCLSVQFTLFVLQVFEWSIDHIWSDILCIQFWPDRIPRVSKKFSLPSSCFERVPSWYGMLKFPCTCGPQPYSHN